MRRNSDSSFSLSHSERVEDLTLQSSTHASMISTVRTTVVALTQYEKVGEEDNYREAVEQLIAFIYLCLNS